MTTLAVKSFLHYFLTCLPPPRIFVGVVAVVVVVVLLLYVNAIHLRSCRESLLT